MLVRQNGVRRRQAPSGRKIPHPPFLHSSIPPPVTKNNSVPPIHPTAPVHPTAQAVHEALARAAAEGAWRIYDGPYLANLRSLLAGHFNCEHVRLCCSGTFAVELAVRSLLLEPNAEVLLAGYDFPGNFRAVQDAGASVGLCDVAFDNWVPGVEQLEAARGPNTRAIVVSHLHGAMAPMASICSWAKQNGLLVIEDACQVHGASVDGKSAGAWGDLGVLSFGGSKLIASGRGGAVLTNDNRFAQRMTVFCERGNDAFALSELQAAVIIPQYEHLAIDHGLRLTAATSLIAHLSKVEWLSFGPLQGMNQPGFYKLGIMVLDSLLNSARVRETVLRSLSAHRIEIGPGFKGFVRRSANRCRQPVPLTNSRTAAERTLVLHHSHLLDPQTGLSSIEQVKAAFQSIHREITS